ncbi:MAG: hypothetical protein WC562_07940 [Dehalococcoidia bacterium]
MIWLRRAFTLPLILLFFVLLVAAVTVTAVNNTVANSEFYNDQMVKADMYNYVYDSVLPAALDEVNTGEGSDAPIDIANFEAEILATAEQVLPPWWLQQQFEEATRVLVPYFVDDTAGFSYTLVVKDRVEDAGQAIKTQILRSDAFVEVYEDLMAFMSEQLYPTLPELPPSVVITQTDVENALKDAVTLPWLVEQLETAIDEVIPYLTGDQNHFIVNIPLQEAVTDDVLLDLLGPGNEAYLNDARDWIGDGWSFTDADMRDELDADAEEKLDDARGYIHDGYVFDQDDLRNAMFDNSQDAQDFDDARHWISVGRSLLWVLWLVPFLLLIGIGFLGGRGWKTRAAGPLVILFFVSLILFLGVMLTWGQWGEAEMRSAIDTSGYQGVEAVMLEKAEEVAINAADSFVGNMQDMYMYLLIASGVGLAAVGVWWLVSSRSREDAS